MDTIKTLCTLLLGNAPAVFLGGAGVSTESGIPDFRGTGGLYNQKWDVPPETILSHDYFMQHTETFYCFYREKMVFPDAKPNRAHTALAEMERMGLLLGVITQNIDGLHQQAGSKTVVELHGSVLRNHCVRCGRAYPGTDIILKSSGVPSCACGGIIKPDVVLYGEALPDEAIERALDLTDRAKLMIVGGTSLTVYPAASFASEFRGKKVVINKQPTQMDHCADLALSISIGEALGACADRLARR